MVRKREAFPEEGELIMATVVDVQQTHAYLILDDYRGLPGEKQGRSSLNVTKEIRNNAMAYMHISELANHWIKNIRDFVKEGQKMVCRVLKVDPRKGHIDVSKRRVSGKEKKQKIMHWKQANKAEGLLKILSIRFEITLQDVYDKLGFPLEDVYGEIWSAFEDIKEHGIEAIMDLDFIEEIDEEWLEELEKIVQQYVEIRTVNIVGELELISYDPAGVELIKKAISSGRKQKPPKGEKVSLDFQLITPPRYRLEIEAGNYQVAETYLKKVTDKIISTIESSNGTGTFTR